MTRKELMINAETGYYENEEEFIIEAIKTLLIARKDLRSGDSLSDVSERGDIFGKSYGDFWNGY